jgi:AraC family transcriptional regulator
VWITNVTRYAPLARLESHHHPRVTLSLVFHGSYVERAGRTALRGESFTAILKPAGIEHENHISADGLHALFAEPSAMVMEVLHPELATLTGPIPIQSARVAALVARVRHEVRDPAGDPPAALCVEGHLLEILAEASRLRRIDVAAGHLSWLDRVRERLHAEFMAHPSIAVLAAGAGVHPVHLVQTFRRRHGCTIGEYVRGRRVEHAATHLRTRCSISRIALDAGFADHSHLTRVFRRVVGVTPTEYRRLVQ